MPFGLRMWLTRLSGGGFAELNRLLNGLSAGVFSGVHLLPFFTTIGCADAGLAPIGGSRLQV